MKKEIEDYFFEKYKKAKFRVVYGHWPDFKSKEDVDKWFSFMEMMIEEAEIDNAQGA